MKALTDADDTRRRATTVRLLALDVDGVLTDGKLVYSSDGEELKAFNILDGLGIKLLQERGVEVAIISGRQSPMLTRRAGELGIRHVIQGREDKREALQSLVETLDIAMEHAAYAGDDLPDLGAIRAAGLGITVPNGHESLQRHARLCTQRRGGDGAVREIADYLLDARGELDSVIAAWL